MIKKKLTTTMNILKSKPVLPGFKLSFAITLFSLSIIILLPIMMLLVSVSNVGWNHFFKIIFSENVLNALGLTLLISFLAVLTNLILGTLIAWVLVRYEFFGKKFLNSIVDLPFALPTSVTGVTLATLYAPNGWIGRFFEPFGIKIAFTNIGIWLALIVVSLPFIIRSIQPVLEELNIEQEEAAATLNISRFKVLSRVILPEISPALIGGVAIAFARCTGEYGSVIFIAGNIPNESEILPLVIASKFEQFDLIAASAIALLMLMISFIVLLFLSWYQRRAARGILA